VRLKRFNYVEPANIKEASSILLKEPGAKILAGGTDLLVNMKHRVEAPALIVNIKRIPGLDAIEPNSGGLRIGALTPLKSIYRHPVVAGSIPALATAAFSVGSYHHQAMGTIGGNLCQQNRCKFYNQSKWWRSARPLCIKAGGEICHVVNQKVDCYATYCGDLAPALLALNARVVLSGESDTREVPLDRLYSGNGKAPLELGRGEILTHILLPEAALNGFSVYIKSANRGSIDFPIVGAAFWASASAGDYGVAFTAVDRRPVKAARIENTLRGKVLNQDILQEVSALIPKEATPVKTSIYAPAYKRQLMTRALQSALKAFQERTKQ